MAGVKRKSIVAIEVLCSRSVFLEAPPPEVFEFHSDPRNISRIAPPGLRVLAVEADVPARCGGTFRLKVSQSGFPMDWHGRWAEVESPRLLVDVADKCPFPGWRHEHIFDNYQGGTRMTDVVSLDVPGGLPGILLRTAFRLVLAAMFFSRHRATRKFFAHKSL